MSSRSLAHHLGTAALLAFVAFGAGAARAESPMQQCATKWSEAKASNTTGGLTYLQFSSKCRADLKAQSTAAPTTTPAAATAPAAAAPATAPAGHMTAKPAPAPAPVATGSAVFPSAVNPAYSQMTPGKAIMKTCVDQYNANKATNSNGGLKWVQKGGGYYSECNKKLKG